MSKTENANQPEEKKASKKKQTNSFQTYIHRLLKSIDPNAQIAVNTRGQLDKVADILARGLAEKARTLCIRSKKKTISPSEIYLSMDLLFPRSLAERASEKVNQAIKEYQDADKGSHTHPVRRETLAGLVFSVALSEKYLREFGASELHVGKMAPIALSAILQYVIGEILRFAINCARDLKRVIVKVRHIRLAVGNDPDISQLFQNFKIELMNGGFIPHIRRELLPSQEKKSAQAARRRKNKKGQPVDSKRSRRLLPGTKAIRDIKHYQKTTECLLQRLPFETSVRGLGKEIRNKDGEEPHLLHFGGGAILTLQAFVEQRVTKLLNKALDCTLHRSRDSVNAKDVTLAWGMDKDSSWVLFTENQLEKIGTNGIERLARRGGVKRTSADMYPVVRSFMYSLVSMVLYKCVHIIAYRKIMTIGVFDLEVAFESFGVNFTIPPHISKAKKSKKSEAKDDSSKDDSSKDDSSKGKSKGKSSKDKSKPKGKSSKDKSKSKGKSSKDKSKSKGKSSKDKSKKSQPEETEEKITPKNIPKKASMSKNNKKRNRMKSKKISKTK
uniref:Histone 2A-domain-containing protein n=1 Tax=Marseillevirus LCMAC101 TaxID=2506602 RepID=A0A481YS31_9VIRU|nr:MAG: histone 2A-domain-containing protein [Marseillevirus LCMAC101]